jgi:hypothetical protein
MSDIPLETIEKKPKSKRGGARPGSGRKPLIDKAEIDRVRALISQHGIEKDPGDIKKRVRILRLLDVLYEKGVSKDDTQAIREYLDRQLGRSKERLDVTTGDLPFNLTIAQKK